MEEKAPERAKRKIQSGQFKVNTPKPQRVLAPGDLNGCLLVIPETFGTDETIMFHRGRLREYDL